MSSMTAEAPPIADEDEPPNRARRRIPIRFVVFGVVAVVVAATLAWMLSWYSPVPVRGVAVTGAASAKQSEVIAAAGISDGTAIKDVDVGQVTERVLAVPGIESVDVVLQRPFTIDLQVTERFPFAARATPTGWLILDQRGASISESTARPKFLPEVSSDDGNVAPAVTAAAGLPPAVRRSIKVAKVAADGSIVITLRQGVTVVWGVAGQDELKGRTVARLLQYKPKGINVSVPERPALTGTLDVPKQNKLQTEEPIP